MKFVDKSHDSVEKKCRHTHRKGMKYEIWFGLVGFYDISTIVGYLMPNPAFTNILNT